jgi:GT2 family glycosyltransferase
MGAEVTVVVPSHNRPLRLRWLLNALEEQTVERGRFQVAVVHDSDGPATDELLREHPLTVAGRLRWQRLPSGTGSPGKQRNVGWRLATTPLIAFTDDDCRPHERWLEELLSCAARSVPGAVVQGRTLPDPFEIEVIRAPYARTLEVDDPPGPFGQTANILYPRELLERLDGFAEDLHSGEDTDLLLRAQELSAPYVGARDALVYHAIEALSLPLAIRVTRKWSDLPHVVRRHPQMRALLTWGVFWRDTHPALLLALAGLAGARRAPVLSALAVLPYLWLQARGRRGLLQLVRAALRTPGRVVIDAAEIVTLARGSVRHRTVML